MLDMIEETLKQATNLQVCYGSDVPLDGTDIWRYVVFRRTKTKVKPTSRTDLVDVYEVYLVYPNYVPAGAAEAAMDALIALKGIRPTGDDITYTQMVRPGTKAAIEVASFTVLAPRKRGFNGD